MYVNVYELDRHYGGPEEGGWWFDAGTVEKSVEIESSKFWTSEAFYRQPGVIPVDVLDEITDTILELEAEYPSGNARFSMVPRSRDFSVRVEDGPGKDFPEVYPHYE